MADRFGDDVGQRVHRRAVDVVRPGFGLRHDRYSKRGSVGVHGLRAGRAVCGAGDDEPGPFGPIRLGGIMSDTPLAGRVAVVSGGGRGLGRSFCRALARQGAKVVVNNRNRVTDADGCGPADHVAAEIVAAGGEAACSTSSRPRSRRGARDQPAGQRPAGPGRDGGDAAGRLRPDHPGRLHRRAARRRRAFRLRGQQGRAAGVRPVAGGGGRGPGRTDQHAAAVRPHPADRRRHARVGPAADGPGPGGAGADRAGQPGVRRVPGHRWGQAAPGIDRGVGTVLLPNGPGLSPGQLHAP